MIRWGDVHCLVALEGPPRLPRGLPGRGRLRALRWIACSDCFFFQAEDGIRDVAVTGVQTCALPISKTGSAFVRLPRAARCWTASATRAASPSPRSPAARSASRPSRARPRRSRWQRTTLRSEEHTSELQSRLHLVCRLLLEKKKNEILNRQKNRITRKLFGTPPAVAPISSSTSSRKRRAQDNTTTGRKARRCCGSVSLFVQS